jgi:hypothetical protein
MSIPSDLISAFHWSSEETNAHLNIIFSFPHTFDLSYVRLQLFKIDSKDCISVTIPNAPFLLHGVLTGRADSAHLTADEINHFIILQICKSDSQTWHFPVKLPVRDLTTIDPKSAYHIANLIMKSRESVAIQLMRHSANCGFVPALIYLGEQLVKDDETFQEGMSFLTIAASKYGDDCARCKLSMLNILNGWDVDVYFQFLRKASEKGIALAHVYLGCILSPLSEIEWREKDPQTAVIHLEKAIETEENEEAFYELAKLLHKGEEGVPVDVPRAVKLYEHACQLAQRMGRNLPELPATKNNVGTSGSGVIFPFAAVALVVAGMLFSRSRSGRA